MKNIINRLSQKIEEKMSAGYKSYFMVYTVLFVIASFFVFSWYFLQGRTLIVGDGRAQHYRALLYYAHYLRSIVQNLLQQHQLIIPSWDFNIGEGSDIFGTLQYYVIGDPFTVLSIFIPDRFMYIYYDMMKLLRLYLSGIAFSCLCFQTGKKNKYAVMAGAMTYVFCYYGIHMVAAHPFFLNPMLYLPMIIIGVEKTLKKKRPYLLIVSVFLATISNLYFLYMLVIITVIYTVLRMIFSYHNDVVQAFAMIIRVGAASLFGIVLAFAVFLPISYVFLTSSRMNAGNTFRLFYSLYYYSQLPARFIAGVDTSYTTCMGFSVPALFAVFLLFRKQKENGLLKGLFITCIIILIIPALGQIFNGFSYMSNRWIFAFALVVAYIMTTAWPLLMNMKLKDSIYLFSCTVVYSIICIMLEYSRITAVFTSLAIGFVFLFILLPMKEGESFLSNRCRQQIALVIILFSIFNVSFWINSSVGINEASAAMEIQKVPDLMTNETLAIKNVATEYDADVFYRYSGRNLTKNAGIQAEMSSTAFYWSFPNPYIMEHRRTMELIGENAPPFSYTGYDDRTALLTLASVYYYVIPASDSLPVPYGFTYVDTINVKESFTDSVLHQLQIELRTKDIPEENIKVIESKTESNYKVYRNDNALPFAYTYSNYISKTAWNNLSTIEKQEAMLQSVVLDGYHDDEFDEAQLSFTSKSIDYALTCEGGATLKDNAFVVTSANATAMLTFDGAADSETYFSIKGLSFQGTPVYDLYFGDETVDPLNLYNETMWKLLSNAEKESVRKDKLFWQDPKTVKLTLKSSTGVSKNLYYLTENFSWYNDRHDFVVNLNYSDEAVTSIKITFPVAGIYAFDSIDVFCQPMGDYAERISALKEDIFENTTINMGVVTGTISLDSPKIVCMSIPYSDGWKAYVDGKAVELYQANGMYMALPLNAGDHTIELTYRTPFLKVGICISFIAFIAFIIFIFFTERKLKNKKMYVKE